MWRSSRAIFAVDGNGEQPATTTTSIANRHRRHRSRHRRPVVGGDSTTNSSSREHWLCFGRVSPVTGAHVVGGVHQVCAIVIVLASYLCYQLESVYYSLPFALITMVASGLLLCGVQRQQPRLILAFLVYQSLIIIGLGCFVAFIGKRSCRPTIGTQFSTIVISLCMRESTRI